MKYRKINTLKENAENPRVLSYTAFDKLKQSIIDFPEMLERRPLIIDENNVVLGGNMRLKALRELNIKEVPTDQVLDWTPKQKREFIIKDNVSFGIWDWDMLASEWNSEPLQEWGLETFAHDVEQPDLDFDKGTPEPKEDPANVTTKRLEQCYDEIKQKEFTRDQFVTWFRLTE